MHANVRAKIIRGIEGGADNTSIGKVTGVSRTTVARVRASLPFSGAPQAPAKIPTIDWTRYGPSPIPNGGAPHVAGYSDHTFTPTAPPLAFDGFTLERLRRAASLHRNGFFVESSLAAISILSFGPCLAALEQRMAPAISLDRQISCEGAKGLVRDYAEEVEAMICPRDGLVPSQCFPTELFGAIEIGLAMFRWAVLQHVDGDPDPDTGVRQRYTRLWPNWATQYYRQQNKWIAFANEGPVEIDGVHFTLVADIDEPHLTSAILALMEEAFAGRQTEQFRNAWIRAFGSPKLVGYLPPKVPTEGEQGKSFYKAAETILGPGGFGVFPNESKMETIGLKGEASGSFKESLDSVIGIIGMVLLGSSGLLDKGSGGVYTSPVYEGVALRLISRDIAARDRAINGGHILPYLRGNYGSQIDAAKAGGRWIDPVLRTPLPDLAAEERFKLSAAKQESYYKALDAEREAGGLVDQARAQEIAERLGASPLVLTTPPDKHGQIYEWHVEQKIVAPDQVLESLGLPPMPDDAGSVDRLAAERLAGKDETGKKASQGDPLIDGKPATVPDDAEPAPKPTEEIGPDGGVVPLDDEPAPP